MHTYAGILTGRRKHDANNKLQGPFYCGLATHRVDQKPGCLEGRIVELQATVIGDLKSTHVKYPQRKDEHIEQLRNHIFKQGVSW